MLEYSHNTKSITRLEQENIAVAHFEQMLNALADNKILSACKVAFPEANTEQIYLRGLGSDFTSFLRVLTFGDRVTVSKISFDASKPRIMDTYSKKGDEGISTLDTKQRVDVPSEYTRHKFLATVFPNLQPKPYAVVDDVAFYQYIDGKTLEEAIVDGEKIDAQNLGVMLRQWHNTLSSEYRVPEPVQEACVGKLDRLSMYQKRYSSIEGLERAFRPLEEHGYKSSSEVDGIIQQLYFCIGILNNSSLFTEPKNVWGHGDFKPENILIQQDTGNIIFIDNDMHLQPSILDVGKFLSRLIALGLGDGVSIAKINEISTRFLEGYYIEETIPFGQLANFIAIDLMVILGSYAAIDKSQLHEYPEMAKLFMFHIDTIVQYVDYLTGKEHTNLESILAYFNKI